MQVFPVFHDYIFQLASFIHTTVVIKSRSPAASQCLFLSSVITPITSVHVHQSTVSSALNVCLAYLQSGLSASDGVAALTAAVCVRWAATHTAVRTAGRKVGLVLLRTHFDWIFSFTLAGG